MSDRTAGGLLPPQATYGDIVATVADPLMHYRVGRVWWIAFAVAGLLTALMVVCIVWLFIQGVGVWGINTADVWGFAIANYVWWIGIGNAGTLISSLLLLTRQSWRSSINRFAEAMTLFAAAIAGLFPILHLGRPYLFYWLTPYPNTMNLWPQWRSALIWDFWAILSYLLFSIMFWYMGLIPDLATLRDRAQTRVKRLLYGAFALGWNGSARAWARHDAAYRAMAALAVPLVCSVHSVVGLDFAASLMPGWEEAIFPPYFVVGAMFSGFAMVVTLAVLIRWGLSLQGIVTVAHFDAMAKFLLLGATVLGVSYATEWFMAWYSGEYSERSLVNFFFTGNYAALYWTMLFCNVAVCQLFWFRPVRRSIAAVFVIAILVNVGMWLERILIVLNTLTHNYVPSLFRVFLPTIWDWLLLAGSLGFFLFLYLIFCRLVPSVSIHEVSRLRHEDGGGP
ncbi:MAG: NrfD/PsrC family molybdoenzyme membrane anchor subunit [Acetobacteraceae bacterium]